MDWLEELLRRIIELILLLLGLFSFKRGLPLWS